jgi:uncharacterized membrane protein
MVVIGIVALWIAFAATHMGLSSLRLRPLLLERLGERGFQGFYSLVALALFVSLVWVYASHKPAGPELWSLGGLPGVRAIMSLGMAVALVLAVGGLLTPSPVSMLPAKTDVKGVFRITRHPLSMGIGLFGLMHLLGTEVHAGELAFFGGFVVFSLVACRHQDQRKLAEGDAAGHPGGNRRSPDRPLPPPDALRRRLSKAQGAGRAGSRGHASRRTRAVLGNREIGQRERRGDAGRIPA